MFGPCYQSARARPQLHARSHGLRRGRSTHRAWLMNFFDLKRVLLDVLEEFDHKNLNLDMPYFQDRIPTSENLARVLWTKLDITKTSARSMPSGCMKTKICMPM